MPVSVTCVVRLPSSSSVVAVAAHVGTRYEAHMRATLDDTTDATARHALHAAGADHLWRLATAGPFDANAAVAWESTLRFYRDHGFTLAAADIAEAAAAGLLRPHGLARLLAARARPA